MTANVAQTHKLVHITPAGAELHCDIEVTRAREGFIAHVARAARRNQREEPQVLERRFAHHMAGTANGALRAAAMEFFEWCTAGSVEKPARPDAR